MSKTTKTAAKTVAKKAEAPVAAAAPAAAAPKKAAKAAAAPVATPAAVPAASAPVEAAAPAPVVSVAEQIQTMVKELSSIRDAASKTIAGLRKLEKQHSREVKEAKRRRRVRKEEGGEAKETRHPSVFTTPYLLKDTLATFLGKDKGTKMTPAEVTKAFKVYIDTHGLKGEKHAINPDAAMRSVLGLKADEVLSYRSIQSYLYKLYIKNE